MISYASASKIRKYKHKIHILINKSTVGTIFLETKYYIEK